ncbi:MAG: DUF928 domain-containing protein [Nitrospiraceae bacterium]
MMSDSETRQHRPSDRSSRQPLARVRRPVTGLLLILLLGVMGGGAGQAQPVESPTSEGRLTRPIPIEPTMPVYKPRVRGPSRGRVDGGFRGGQEGEPILKVLAPADHVGETVKKRPALYWFLSSPTPYPIVFTLEDTNQYKPVVERTLPSPSGTGIQMIRLADFEQVLEEQVQYRWHISVVVDPESRSKDIHAMGIIERRPYTEDLFLNTTCKDPRDAICLYADAGLWYDAIIVISDLIMAHPKDRVLRLQRAALLEQIGLSDVAEFDRHANPSP